MKSQQSNTLSPTYIFALQKEAKVLKSLSQKWNKSDTFSNTIAQFLDNEFTDVVYPSEHLVLRDFILLIKRITAYHKLSVPAKFALIYFYEMLQGKDIATQYSMDEIQKLISSSTFDKNIQTILEIEFFEQKYKDEFLLNSVLNVEDKSEFKKVNSLFLKVLTLVIKEQQSLTSSDKNFIEKIEQELSRPKTLKSTLELSGIPANDSLEKVMAELHELIGLQEIKKSVEDLTNFLKVQKIREEQGLKTTRNSLHAVFLGPPGTGKTTVARLLGRIYKHLGYLEKGHLVETDRSGLVAGYVGQTALKTDEIIKKAIGGVLFIDEAYSLASGGLNDFGNEAIEVLLKRMEDNRNNLVVVVAGYDEEMEIFIQSNPGLQSRFNRYFKFKHLEADALMSIFKLNATKVDFVLTSDAEEKLAEIIERLCENRTREFGNARTIRNLFEKIIEQQANRISKLNTLDKDTLMKIEECDVPEVLKVIQEINPFDEK